MLSILSPGSSSPSLAPPTNTFMISSGDPPSTSEPPRSLNPQGACVPSLTNSTGTRYSTYWVSSSTEHVCWCCSVILLFIIL